MTRMPRVDGGASGRDIEGGAVHIVLLRGRLGNQMFQYALARQLGLVEGRRVVLSPSGIGGLQHCRLDLFNTTVPVLTDEEAARIEAQHVAPHTIDEGVPGFIPGVLDRHDAPVTILNGFWQCERYFPDVSQLLRSEFTLKEPLPPSAPNLARLQRPNSVCLHVRLGDYLRPEGAFLAFADLDYYRRAIAEMVQRVPDAHFFVFSDDIGWCMETLQIDHPHSFINFDPGPTKPAQVLSVMSHCSHFVISNSTFSWWAAWLGNAADKIVIAPKGWFANERGGPNTARFSELSSKDLIPPSWLRV